MYWLKIENLILICSVLFSLWLQPKAHAIEEQESFVQLSRLANKGEKIAQYELAKMMMDKNSTFHSPAEGLKQLSKLASGRHILSMQYIAQHYAINAQATFKPRKALFWYDVLKRANIDINPFLYHFTLLNLSKASADEIDKLLKQTNGDDSWQRTLLKARVYDVGFGQNESKIEAMLLYQEVESRGIDMSYFTRPIFFGWYAPRFQSIELLSVSFDTLEQEMVNAVNAQNMPLSDTQLKYLSLESSEESTLQGLGVKLDSQGITNEVSQYFSATTTQTFTQLKRHYLARFGPPTKQEDLLTMWEFNGLEILLIKSKSNHHRLVTRIVG